MDWHCCNLSQQKPVEAAGAIANDEVSWSNTMIRRQRNTSSDVALRREGQSERDHTNHVDKPPNYAELPVAQLHWRVTRLCRQSVQLRWQTIQEHHRTISPTTLPTGLQIDLARQEAIRGARIAPIPHLRLLHYHRQFAHREISVIIGNEGAKRGKRDVSLSKTGRGLQHLRDIRVAGGLHHQREVEVECQANAGTEVEARRGKEVNLSQVGYDSRKSSLQTAWRRILKSGIDWWSVKR